MVPPAVQDFVDRVLRLGVARHDLPQLLVVSGLERDRNQVARVQEVAATTESAGTFTAHYRI